MAPNRLADCAARADSILDPTQAAKVCIQLAHVVCETRIVGQVERRLLA